MWPQHYEKTVKKDRIGLSRRFNQFMQHHDIAEILIKLAYNTNQSIYSVDIFIPENIQSLICSGPHLICRCSHLSIRAPWGLIFLRFCLRGLKQVMEQESIGIDTSMGIFIRYLHIQSLICSGSHLICRLCSIIYKFIYTLSDT